MKVLVLLAVLAIAWSLWRSNRRARRQPAASPPPTAQDMLACAHCGVHIPRAEALLEGGKPYCSAAHQRLGPA